jgi:ABC-type branched-subunit amino acid transport system ATPase component
VAVEQGFAVQGVLMAWVVLLCMYGVMTMRQGCTVVLCTRGGMGYSTVLRAAMGTLHACNTKLCCKSRTCQHAAC